MKFEKWESLCKSHEISESCPRRSPGGALVFVKAPETIPAVVSPRCAASGFLWAYQCSRLDFRA